LEESNIVIAGTVIIGVLWELHVNVVQIAEGKVESAGLGLLTDMLVDDELHCTYVLDFTPIVLYVSVTDQSTEENHDLSVDDLYAIRLMSVYQRCTMCLS
jgi:hypothetical protein